MSEFSLFIFFLVTLRYFSGACLFKIAVLFFKGQNYTIAIVLVLGLLMGHWCVCEDCGWKCRFFCLGWRSKKLYFLVEMLRSCPEWKFLKRGIF